MSKTSTINVRVRGIYATAITKLLLDYGFTIVQASDKIKSRFKSVFTNKPADVTIKDMDNKLGFIIIGEPTAVKTVFNHLNEVLENSIIFQSKIPLHALIKGRVVEKVNEKTYIVDLGEVKGELYTTQQLNVGDEVLVDVKKTQLKPREKIILSFNYNIYGPNIVLIYKLPKIIVSRHIKDPELRRELITLASLYRMKNSDWGIKWRSSAKYTSLSELMSELKQLYKRAEEVLSKARNSKLYEIIEPGQLIIEVVLSKSDKEKLDSIRQSVTPTVIGHHMLKSFGKKSSTIVDTVEYIMKYLNIDQRKISECLLEYLINCLSEQKEIKIYHVRVYDDKVLKLTPGKIIAIKDDKVLGKVIVLKRKIIGKGVYNGLNIPKEPGDYDEMIVPLNRWLLIHNYYSKRGELKGKYININTPVELSLSSIRYIDLSLDIIVDKNNNIKLVDVDEFKELVNRGIITHKITSIVEGELKTLLGKEISLHNILTCSGAGVPEPGQRGRAQDRS